MNSPDSKSAQNRIVSSQLVSLEHRLANTRNAASACTLPQTSLVKAIPMSFGQERMWFLDQFEPVRAAYNRPAVLLISGPLDIVILERSLSEIVRRHQVLRTVYRQEAGRAIQEVREPAPVEIRVVDLLAIPEATRKSEAERLARDEMNRSFDLRDDLMFRAQLIRLAEDKHWLVLTTHHIAFDGWSQGVLHDELATLYGAFRDGRTSPLAELPLQYFDYSIRQRDWALGPEASQQLDWWKHTLQGASTVLELPSDRSRPSVQSMRGERLPVNVSKPLTDALRDLATRNQSTLFMVLMATWNVLLHRYTGQEDILVGLPIVGRTPKEAEQSIGLFMNMLPLRTNLAGNPCFLELLGMVREMALSVFKNQDVPLQLLMESMSIQRDTSRAPLFQHMFILQDAQPSAKHLGELSFDSMEMGTSTSKLDLTLELRESSEGLHGCLEYDSDLFDSSTIERMASHFVRLLEGIATDATARISELPLLTKAEQHQLLVEWNDTAVEYPQDRCVHELFEAQVERTPDSVAVVFEDQELTYGELNARANQLAHHLIGLGVGPESLVGLCVDRSWELVVGILGILKAGGAYVPLDSKLPRQRLEFMVQDANLRFLVSKRELFDGISIPIEHPVFMDLNDSECRSTSISNVQSGAGPCDLAYTMYTSGSTGQPKGVQISHSAVVNFLTAMADKPGLSSRDRMLSVTTPTFDISVLELLLPLIVGASVELVSTHLAADAVGLAHHMSNSAVTMIQATPTTWQMLIQSGWKGDSKIKLLCGGEALPDALLGELSRRCNQLWNMYGPTETTVWSTAVHVTAEMLPGAIGRPIGNTQVYVLDKHRQLVPIGVSGELYIGGAGLARGYLNRPELTAEKFVSDPFSQTPGGRLYRTGDLCRWRSDGNLEFLGRIDDQVKLRGFRIELGEIEAVLNEHPAIGHGIVLLREDKPGDKRLVAYCVAKRARVLNTSELRTHLQQRLPEYMVPTWYVQLDSIPVTSSGKIHRRGLPKPDESRPEMATGYVAPRNALEEQLASIWSDLLNIEKVGVHDNFFTLGGHSLLTVKLFAEIERRVGVRLPLVSIFRQGTLAELSSLIEKQLGQTVPKDWVTPIRLKDSVSRDTIFFLPGIGGELLHAGPFLNSLGARFELVGLQPDLGTVPDQMGFLTDFTETAKRYVQALQSYRKEGSISLIGYSYGGTLAFEVARLLELEGTMVHSAFLIDAGPGGGDSPKGLLDGAIGFSRILRNFPNWILGELPRLGHRRWWTLGMRKLNGRTRRFVSKLRNKTGNDVSLQIDEVWDLSHVPSQNHSMRTSLFDAFLKYRSSYWSGKVVLFRSRVRPLFSTSPEDFGWRKYAGSVEVVRLQGDHESVIRNPQNIERIAQEILSRLDPECNE